MAIGERIHFFRNKCGMTMRQLGMLLGFPEKSADVRVSQYESGMRTPKSGVVEKLAATFKVRPEALTVPDIDTYRGLMHTLFTLEDTRGLKISDIDGELCLRLDKFDRHNSMMFSMFYAWRQESLKLESGEITKEEYDRWRYQFGGDDL